MFIAVVNYWETVTGKYWREREEFLLQVLNFQKHCHQRPAVANATFSSVCNNRYAPNLAPLLLTLTAYFISFVSATLNIALKRPTYQSSLYYRCIVRMLGPARRRPGLKLADHGGQWTSALYNRSFNYGG